MSITGLTIIDGTSLRSIDLTLPNLEYSLTGAQLIEISISKVSQSLSLPPHIIDSAISKITAGDDATFRLTSLNRQQATEKLELFISTVAHTLNDSPIVVSILDGSSLKMFLEDEDDFAMLAENLFTDLDEDDNGKLCKSDVRKALLHMGVDMGVPPLSEFSMLDDVIKKHDADGDEKLGQAQFAELLQVVLQDVADILHEKPITVVLNVEVFNGSRLHKILVDEKKLNCLLEIMMLDVSDRKDDQGWDDLIKTLIEKNGKELGLPPLSSDNEQVALLYETVFSQVNNKEKETTDPSRDGYVDALKDVLRKFEELLEATPVYCATDL